MPPKNGENDNPAMPTMKTQQLQQQQKQASAAPLRVVTVYRHVPGRVAHPTNFRRSLPLIGRFSFDRAAPTLSRLEWLVHGATSVPPPQLSFYVHRPSRRGGEAKKELGLKLVEDDVFDEDERCGGRRRRAPYAESVNRSFFVAHRQWGGIGGMLECVLFVRFASDDECSADSSLSPLVTWPSDTKFDLPLHITATLRSTSATDDLLTIAFSAQTARIWDLKLDVERITGAPPSRQILEYRCQPVEDSFQDVIHDPSSQYGLIDGVLLRDVIWRDPAERRDGNGGDGGSSSSSRIKVNPELRACCAEIPYQLFVRFLVPSPCVTEQQQQQLDHNVSTQSSSLRPPSKMSRHKKKQKQVNLIKIDVCEDDRKETRKGNDDKKSRKLEEESREIAAKEESVIRPPDSKRRCIKIKNVIMKHGTPDTCGSIDPQSSQPASPREGNSKDSAAVNRMCATKASTSSSSSKSKKGPASSPSRRSRTADPSNVRRAERVAPPTPVSSLVKQPSPPLSSSGLSSSSLRQTSSHRPQGTHPSLSSSCYDPALPSPSCVQPSFHCQPPNDVWQWLHTLDAEGGGRGGRIVRHAGAFMREFPCLEDVASACDMEGPDRVLDACGVTAMGERVCLKRAMKALPRL